MARTPRRGRGRETLAMHRGAAADLPHARRARGTGDGRSEGRRHAAPSAPLPPGPRTPKTRPAGPKQVLAGCGKWLHCFRAGAARFAFAGGRRGACRGARACLAPGGVARKAGERTARVSLAAPGGGIGLL